MKKKKTVSNPNVQISHTEKGTRLRMCGKLFRRDWQLHLLLLLPVIYLLVFHYYPIYGVQIAFRNYRAKAGIVGSEWVGLKWFEKFLTNYNFQQIFGNTIKTSLYSILIGEPLPVILALLFNSMKNDRFRKVAQTMSYLPHFISIVVLVSIFNQVFNPMNGLYGTLARLFGYEGYPKDFRALASSFRHIYVWSDIWQNIGWSTIIYTAALSGVSPDHHEAAQIDGASRFQRVLYVDLPAILPTAAIMLILRCGSVMTIGFEKAYLLQSDLNATTSEVISTYVYKVGMGASRDFSYGAAIGLFNSLINCTILILVNWISKKLSSNEVSLF